MELGEAIYREITGRSSATEVTSFSKALSYLVNLFSGNKAAAARSIGVPPTTFRAWVRGRPPRGARADVVEAARRAQRRARLPRGREKRMRRANALAGVRIVGAVTYDGTPEPDRDVALGQYLDEIQGDILDAYLDGASPDTLADIFNEGINGAPFYEQTLKPGGDGAHLDWDIDDFEGWA